MGSVGNSNNTNIIKQFQSIQQQIKNKELTYDRAYLDISDNFADNVFNTYDPVDLYMYLSNKEQRQAYKDMQGIGANSRQIQYEWKKKAIYQVAKKWAWDELDFDDED